MTSLIYIVATAEQTSRMPLAVIAPPNPKKGDLVLVKPALGADTPYWGKLLEPLHPDSDSSPASWTWTVERMTDQEFSHLIKSELLERDRILTVDEILEMHGATL